MIYIQNQSNNVFLIIREEENERYRRLRRKKKDRLTKREMLETYLEKHHSNILEEFEKFYEQRENSLHAPLTSPFAISFFGNI